MFLCVHTEPVCTKSARVFTVPKSTTEASRARLTCVAFVSCIGRRDCMYMSRNAAGSECNDEARVQFCVPELLRTPYTRHNHFFYISAAAGWPWLSIENGSLDTWGCL